MRSTRSLRTALIASTAVVLAIGASLVTGVAGASNHDQPYAVSVTVTNLAPSGGTIITPVWIGLHDGNFDLYDRGAPTSAQLERLVEDGNTGPISELFAATGNGSDTTVVGPGGPVFPGESASTTFYVNSAADTARYLSLASMVIPSNDAFVANGDPMSHPVFDGDGNFVGQDFVILGGSVLDAGTEVNDEIPANTAALAQAAPDTGVAEGGVVATHAGFMPGGNVLAAIPNGDFTTAGYEVALVEIDARPIDLSNRNVYGVLDGGQEVPAVDTRSLGYVVLELRANGRYINVDTQWWNTRNVRASHLHLGAAGENGPVIVTLSGPQPGLADGSVADGRIDARDLSGPLAGQPLSALYDAIAEGNVYINVHTDAVPSGELRGQLVP